MANELVLIFDFKTAPSAEELGEVFVALARDYRDMSNGRKLVVSQIQSGSIIVTLTDAALAAAPYVLGSVAAMAAINTVAKFAENLQQWFGRAKTDEGKKRLYRKGRKSPGQRSVEAIIKAAANTGSHVKVKYAKSNGETLEAELTPLQAIAAQEQAEAQEVNVTRVKDAKQRIEFSDPEVQGAIKRLEQIGTQNPSVTDIQTVVDVIVAVLKAAGAGHLLPEIASQLSMNGLYTIADAVRQHIHPGGNLEPPLTTT